MPANMDLDSGDNTVSFTTAGNLTQTEDCPADVFATFNEVEAKFGNATIPEIK